MSELSTRTTHIIAAEINNIKEQTRKTFLYNSIEIGRRLAEAKIMIPHGEWGVWLEKNVDFSQTTANNLIKIFEQYASDQLSLFGDNLKSQAFANLSYSQALALLGVPEDQREAFVKENDVGKMSTRELQQAIKEKQKLELELKKNEKMTAELAKENKEREEIIRRLEKQLEVARQSGNEVDVESLKSRIQQLEKELKEKPVEAHVIVEKIPEEIEEELTELRKKATLLNSESTMKFKFCFDSLVSGFRDLLSALDEIKEQDPGSHDKYLNAVKSLLGKMSERL